MYNLKCIHDIYKYFYGIQVKKESKLVHSKYEKGQREKFLVMKNGGHQGIGDRDVSKSQRGAILSKGLVQDYWDS